MKARIYLMAILGVAWAFMWGIERRPEFI